MGGLRSQLKYIADFRNQVEVNKKNNVKYINWWGNKSDYEQIWFSRFIRDRHILRPSSSSSIVFFSIFGKPLSILLFRGKAKVFFSGENLHRDERGFRFSKYENYGLNMGIDLALGFDYLDDKRYFRLPLWILNIINPDQTSKNGIDNICLKLSHNVTKDNELNFCSMISSHDPNGLRAEIFKDLQSIDTVLSGGKLLNNTDLLKNKYADNKQDFCRQTKFNICSENSNAKGYVTEKIFEAISAGCIPIYWGSDNDPEPEVLNKDAIIFWKQGGDNSETIQLISELHHNKKLYQEFANQPRLLPTATEYIQHTLNEFEVRLKKLL